MALGALMRVSGVAQRAPGGRGGEVLGRLSRADSLAEASTRTRVRVGVGRTATVTAMNDAEMGTLIAGVIVAVAGVAVVVVGRLMQQGRLPLQAWAGIRTRSTMRSDDAWMAAHRAGGR